MFSIIHKLSIENIFCKTFHPPHNLLWNLFSKPIFAKQNTNSTPPIPTPTPSQYATYLPLTVEEAFLTVLSRHPLHYSLFEYSEKDVLGIINF